MKISIAKYRHLYLKIARYPKRYRYYITLLMLCAIISPWYIFLYRPVKHSINYYANTKNTLGAQIQEQKKAQESIITLGKSIKGLEQDLRTHKTSAIDSNELIIFIAQQATHANLFLESCTAESIVDHGWVQSQPILVNVQGPISAVSQWLGSIATKTKTLSIDSLSITKIDQTLVRCSIICSYLKITNI